MGVSAVIMRHNPEFHTGHGVPVKTSRMHSRGVVLIIQKGRRNYNNLEEKGLPATGRCRPNRKLFAIPEPLGLCRYGAPAKRRLTGRSALTRHNPEVGIMDPAALAAGVRPYLLDRSRAHRRWPARAASGRAAIPARIGRSLAPRRRGRRAPSWPPARPLLTGAGRREPNPGDNTGNTMIWFMNGTSVASTAPPGNIPIIWTVQSVNAE